MINYFKKYFKLNIEENIKLEESSFYKEFGFNVDFSLINKNTYENNKLYLPGNRNNSYLKIFHDIDSWENILLGNFKYFENSNNLQHVYFNGLFEKFLKYEKNYNDGDYCINFYNPDYKLIDKSKNKISLKEAIKIFKNIFNKNNKSDDNKIFYNNIYKAFIHAFMRLESSDNLLEEKLIKNFDKKKFDKNNFKAKLKKLKTDTYNKKLFNGHYYEIIKEELEINVETNKTCKIKHWVRTSHLAKDFSTLFRNLVLIILGFNGYLVRSFINSTGEYICLIVYHQNKNMKKLAEIFEINKKWDINVIDLLSFEPIDNKNRPLRLNRILWSRKLWNKYYESDEKIEYHKKGELIKDSRRRLEILDYIKNKINFKALYNQLKFKWNSEESYSNMETLILKNEKIDSETWNIYLTFLKLLYDKKIDIDKEYNIEVNQIEKNKLILSKNSLKLNKKKFKKLRILNKKNYIYNFRVKMTDLMKKLNEDTQTRALVNIWNKLNIPPNEPYLKFSNISKFRKFRFKYFNSIIWKYYVNFQDSKKSLFTNVEILKLIIKHFEKIFNLDFLTSFINTNNNVFGIKSQDVIFPLHDYIRMFGNQYVSNYEKVIKLKQNHLDIKKDKVKILYDPETINKFNNTRTLNKYKKINDEYKNFILNKFKQAQFSETQRKLAIINQKNNVINKTISTVINSLNFNFFFGIERSTKNMKNYFGEKIAIYFKFLSFLITNLYIMILLIIPYLVLHIIYGIEYFNFPNLAAQIYYILVFFLNMYFIFIISLRWIKLENYFNFTFGNTEFHEEHNNNLKVRSDFKSNYVRDLINDDFNTLNPNIKNKILKRLLSILILIILIIISFTTTALILNLKIYVIDNNLLTNKEYIPYVYDLEINNLWFSSFEITKNYILSKISFYVIIYLVKFENYKYVMDNDNSMILKLSIYEISTQSFFIFLILFYNYEKTDTLTAFNITEYYLFIYYIFYFLYSLIKFLFNYILIKKKIKKCYNFIYSKDKKINSKNNYIMENINKKLNNKEKFYLWGQSYKGLNNLIEKQISLENIINNIDTIEDYLEIFRILSITMLFGILIPLSYWILSIIIIFEYFNDKNILLYLEKRTIPDSYTSIGLWKEILAHISLFSIVTNIYFLLIIFFVEANDSTFVIIFISLISLFYLVYNIIFMTKSKLRIKLKKRNIFIKNLIENNIFSNSKFSSNNLKLEYINCINNINKRKAY